MNPIDNPNSREAVEVPLAVVTSSSPEDALIASVSIKPTRSTDSKSEASLLLIASESESNDQVVVPALLSTEKDEVAGVEVNSAEVVVVATVESSIGDVSQERNMDQVRNIYLFIICEDILLSSANRIGCYRL